MLIRLCNVLPLLIIQIFSLIPSSLSYPPPTFNISRFLFPRSTFLTEPDPPPHPRPFLQGVLEAIANKEKWDLEDVKVSRLDLKKVKYGSVQRYAFRVRVGKIEFDLKLLEQISKWKKLEGFAKNGLMNFESLIKEIGSNVVVDSFKIEGPLELRVRGDDDKLSLLLPLNISHTGLRRILVGEGITVEVKDAEEISLSQPSVHKYQAIYGSVLTNRKSEVGSWWPGFCQALLPVRINGSASVFAYKTGKPTGYIETVSPSSDLIKLLPEKCYVRPNYRKQDSLFGSLGSRIISLDRVLRILSEKSKTSATLGPIKSKITALSIFRFQLELERDVQSNDTYWSTLAEWRTKPNVERVWFEVVARLEGELLKPLMVKKVRPFMEVDSFAWSSLLSNLSFTKFPSVLVPPEALTLDVKW